ncbi:hypothetical protein Aperf_G00000062726 [Anoplocephala perfoliata]
MLSDLKVEEQERRGKAGKEASPILATMDPITIFLKRIVPTTIDVPSPQWVAEEVRSSVILMKLVEPRKRRASVEAIVKSKKPESAVIAQTNIPTGPPEQKRFLTVKANADRDVLSPNRAITGYADNNRFKNIQKPMISNREGPKARSYVSKYGAPEAVDKAFPILSAPVKSHVPKYRLMEMLVTTEDFTEREALFPGGGPGGLDSYEPIDGPWESVGSWPFDPKDENLNAMRIELEKREIRPGEPIKGQVFFDLKDPNTISNLQVIPRNTLTMSKLNEKFESTEGVYEPFDIEPKSFPKTINLDKGESGIPFTLIPKKDLPPSYTYISQDGKTMFNNTYFAEAKARVGRDPKSTNGAAVKVLAVDGTDEYNYYTNDKNNFLVSRQYVKDGDVFDYSYFYNKGDDPGKVELVCKAKSNKFNYKDEKVLNTFDCEEKSRKKDSVYNDAPKSIQDKINSDLDVSIPNTNVKIKSTTPTITKGDFTCEYFLRSEKTKDEIPLTKVDAYKK